MGYSGAGGKLIHEKKQKSKIFWHCPFQHSVSGSRFRNGKTLMSHGQVEDLTNKTNNGVLPILAGGGGMLYLLTSMIRRSTCWMDQLPQQQKNRVYETC